MSVRGYLDAALLTVNETRQLREDFRNETFGGKPKTPSGIKHPKFRESMLGTGKRVLVTPTLRMDDKLQTNPASNMNSFRAVPQHN